jgi:hypothetical protein
MYINYNHIYIIFTLKIITFENHLLLKNVILFLGKDCNYDDDLLRPKHVAFLE